MKIRLNEVPKEGRDYTFDRASGELNEALMDLLEKRPYSVELNIQPIDNAYEMRGKVKTQVAAVCSGCGWDFELPVDRRFHEIIFEEDRDEHRKSHSVHGNQSVDFLNDATSMVAVKNDVLDAGEFVHEVIALAQPFYPMCGGEECLRADEVRELRERLEAEFVAATEKKAQGHPAFSVLQGLELNKKN